MLLEIIYTLPITHLQGVYTSLCQSDSHLGSGYLKYHGMSCRFPLRYDLF